MKRIFILSRQPMFSRCVTSLLERSPGMVIVGKEQDTSAAIERVEVLQPDVVIVDTSDPECDPSLVVMRVLEQNAGRKVLGLDMRDNIIHIYRGEQRIVRDLSDLFDAIESGQRGDQPVA